MNLPAGSFFGVDFKTGTYASLEDELTSLARQSGLGGLRFNNVSWIAGRSLARLESMSKTGVFMEGKPATPKLCMTRNLNKHSEFQPAAGFLQAQRTIPREPKLGFRISKLE